MSDDYGMEDMVGVIKIKDGLFICDELGAQVSKLQTRAAAYRGHQVS